MKSSRLILPAAALLGVIPQAAHAHGALEGVGDFYAGLLHPLVAPAEMLVIVATGLLIGRSGLPACRYGILAFASAIAAGLVLGAIGAASTDQTTSLALLALVAAAMVASGLRAPAWIAAGLAVPAGLVLGLDATPEGSMRLGGVLSGLATLLGAVALITILAALALRIERYWQRIAAQVAGSWITASAMLYLAYQLVGLR
ncbi:MAG: HupE/UreJ family protein [Chelatococcus sp.]|uniref:HupE/UreJ family protein n=1 Tax=Chelatococcus sp. TaxID=1953771 RepID=UPI0025C31C39|nr:HupE/UreJ family protein [Chelatococcus sp.]MBX3536914.1 HupE/UreJ family protein [Chelatococcus sp.]